MGRLFSLKVAVFVH